MEQVGVDVALSPQFLTVGVILRFIRKGDVVAVMLFDGAKAEAMEVIVPSDSKITGKSLASITMPPQSLIGMVVRGGKALIPDGNLILKEGDRAIIFTLPDTAQEVSALFHRG